ncbi:MAG: hypothetical protein J6T18_06405 [Bacteroidaceae bacterium]|nr:hypothetical protein [Bacteroidaceae bacterium]MBO7589035.1 hypothetical protein [Bacteroidaceae bacterium]
MNDYLYFNTRDEFDRIDISRIVFFEADGNYTNIMLTGNLKVVIGINLSRMEQYLSDSLREKASNHKPTADGRGEQTIVVPENPVPHKEPEHTHNPEQEQKHKPEPEEKPVPLPPPTPKGNGFPKWPYAVIAVLVGVIVFLLIPRGGKRVQTSQPSSGTENGHEWVDLGLSVKWATCNVGASSPSAYGDYYAWGETSTKSSYTVENYRFRTSGNSWDNVKLSKYNTQSDRGIVDNRSTLELSDDVASQKWGGSWRMPTYEEFDELLDKCTWEWTTLNGVGGYRVTSEIPGYTDRSIFLPAAGCRDDTSLFDAGSSGYYWSGSLYTDYPYLAWDLGFDSDYHDASGYYRYGGLSVRPVFP